MPNPKKKRSPCLACGKEPERSAYKYCSNLCQLAYQRHMYIQRWKRGEVTGLNNIGMVSKSLKIYLRDKFRNKCSLCGWARINPKTKKVPLVADHIDGNWRNNKETNLRLICPNCDALNATYAGSNKGKGRPMRAPSKRAQEGRTHVR